MRFYTTNAIYIFFPSTNIFIFILFLIPPLFQFSLLFNCCCVVDVVVTGERPIWKPLPDGWTSAFDINTQQTYYIHAASGKTTVSRHHHTVLCDGLID